MSNVVERQSRLSQPGRGNDAAAVKLDFGGCHRVVDRLHGPHHEWDAAIEELLGAFAVTRLPEPLHIGEEPGEVRRRHVADGAALEGVEEAQPTPAAADSEAIA